MERAKGSVEGVGMSSARFWKNKKVLVTGHEGFLGSNLTRTLVEKGAKVYGIDKVLNRPRSILDGIRRKFTSSACDISRRKPLRRVFEKFQPRYVFHLAAQAIVQKANHDPLEAFKSNIQGTWNLLETAREQEGVEAIIVASSDKAYGSHDRLPYHENYSLQGDHPYDVSKSCTDLLCRTYHHTYGVPVGITRCGNIYGPGDYHFSRIIPDAARSLLKGKQLVIRSDGKFTRDYIYVDDVVSAYLLLAEKFKILRLSGEAFNFSTESPISVIDLFREISALTKDAGPEPKILNQAEYEIRDQYLSAKKARTILGWKPRYDLKTGLKKTLDWYRDHV
jgi:CDP-glucose 4,6-dehydratase